MKTKLIKTTMCSLLFASSLVTLAAVAMTSATARADSDGSSCGVYTLHASYLFATHGWNIVGGVAQPKAIVEGIDFNGDGTLVSPFATVSINGTIVRTTGTVGTYTVNPDCTGTYTATDENGVVTHADMFIPRDGSEIDMIFTDHTVVDAFVERRVGQ